MPFLRLLSNALLAASLGVAVLAHVVLLLNPSLPVRPDVVFSLGWRLVVTAGAMLTTAFFVVSLARYLTTRRGPGWLSLRLLAWMTTLVVGLGALLAWLNLSAFQASLSPVAGRRFAVAALTLSVTAAVLLLIAVVHYGFGRRGSRVGGALLAIAALAAVILPAVARGPGEPRAPFAGAVRPVDASLREPAAGRVWLLLLDGASLDYVSPAAAQGRLPHLGRLLDGGASLTLFSIEPRVPAPIWAAVATGRYPYGTGVLADARYHGGWADLDLLPRYVFADLLVHSGLFRRVPLRADDLRGVPIWRVLDAADVPALTAGWPLARASDLRVGQVLEDAAARPDADPVAADRTLRERFERALGSRPVALAALRYAALPLLGGDGPSSRSDASRRGAVDAVYDFIDAEVGRVIAGLGTDDLLLVISGYRLEPESPFVRIRNRAMDDAGLAAEARRSDGFLLAYGRHVAPGRKPVGAIVDVLPTVLYYLGLPVPRDIDGFARTDLFAGTLTTGRPVSFIRSYR